MSAIFPVDGPIAIAFVDPVGAAFSPGQPLVSFASYSWQTL